MAVTIFIKVLLCTVGIVSTLRHYLISQIARKLISSWFEVVLHFVSLWRKCDQYQFIWSLSELYKYAFLTVVHNNQIQLQIESATCMGAAQCTFCKYGRKNS